MRENQHRDENDSKIGVIFFQIKANVQNKTKHTNILRTHTHTQIDYTDKINPKKKQKEKKQNINEFIKNPTNNKTKNTLILLGN